MVRYAHNVLGRLGLPSSQERRAAITPLMTRPESFQALVGPFVWQDQPLRVVLIVKGQGIWCPG